MSDQGSVVLVITFSGRENKLTLTLPASDADRFESAHDAWLESGKPHGQFSFQEDDTTTYIRFGHITMWTKCPADE